MEAYNQLLAKKDELEHIIKEKKDRLMLPITESINELSMYDQHPGEIGSEVYEREKDSGLLELLELELEKVEDALNRYQNGQHGICDSCGSPIEKARLDRLVNTTLCTNCAKLRQDRFKRPGEEDITTAGDMSDEGETFQIAGYEFYE